MTAPWIIAAGREPVPVWVVGRDFHVQCAWAFYSPSRQGWAVYDGEGMHVRSVDPDGGPGRLPAGAFLTREEALDEALTDAVQSLRDLEAEEPKRIAETRRQLQEAIARLEREVALGE